MGRCLLFSSLSIKNYYSTPAPYIHPSNFSADADDDLMLYIRQPYTEWRTDVYNFEKQTEKNNQTLHSAGYLSDCIKTINKYTLLFLSSTN